MISLEIRSPISAIFWRPRFKCKLSGSRVGNITWNVRLSLVFNYLVSENAIFFRKVKGRNVIKNGMIVGFEYFDEDRIESGFSYKIIFTPQGAIIEVGEQRWMVKEDSPGSKRLSILCDHFGVVGHVDMKSIHEDWSVSLAESTSEWEHLLAGIIMYRCGSDLYYG